MNTLKPNSIACIGKALQNVLHGKAIDFKAFERLPVAPTSHKSELKVIVIKARARPTLVTIKAGKYELKLCSDQLQSLADALHRAAFQIDDPLPEDVSEVTLEFVAFAVTADTSAGDLP